LPERYPMERDQGIMVPIQIQKIDDLFPFLNRREKSRYAA
jgi:hypothetical protein